MVDCSGREMPSAAPTLASRETWRRRSPSLLPGHQDLRSACTPCAKWGLPRSGRVGVGGVHCSWRVAGRRLQLPYIMQPQAIPGCLNAPENSPSPCRSSVSYTRHKGSGAAATGGQPGCVRRSVMQGLADATGRSWVSPKEVPQGPNGRERRQRPTQKSQSKRPAEMTKIPMESVGLRTTTTDGVREDPMVVGKQVGSKVKTRTNATCAGQC